MFAGMNTKFDARKPKKIIHPAGPEDTVRVGNIKTCRPAALSGFSALTTINARRAYGHLSTTRFAFWSALPVRLGPLRRFLDGARPTGRLPLLADARSAHPASHSFT